MSDHIRGLNGFNLLNPEPEPEILDSLAPELEPKISKMGEPEPKVSKLNPNPKTRVQ